MTRKTHRESKPPLEAQEPAEQPETESTGDAASVDCTPAELMTEEAEGSEALVEEQAPASVEEAADDLTRKLTEELEALNDRYLRLAAEFDNYRKRVAREQADGRTRAQAEVVGRLIQALDDLARVAGLEESDASVHDVVMGVHLVERKLLQEISDLGVLRLGGEGEVFDPNNHEAVGAMPVGEDAEPGTIAAVLQPGYRLGPTLLRPARVLVYVTPEPAEEPSGEA